MKTSPGRTRARFGATLEGMAQAVRLNAVLNKAVYRNCLACLVPHVRYDASIEVARIETKLPNDGHSTDSLNCR
jgi:hypothetical protein